MKKENRKKVLTKSHQILTDVQVRGKTLDNTQSNNTHTHIIKKDLQG